MSNNDLSSIISKDIINHIINNKEHDKTYEEFILTSLAFPLINNINTANELKENYFTLICDVLEKCNNEVLTNEDLITITDKCLMIVSSYLEHPVNVVRGVIRMLNIIIIRFKERINMDLILYEELIPIFVPIALPFVRTNPTTMKSYFDTIIDLKRSLCLKTINKSVLEKSNEGLSIGDTGEYIRGENESIYLDAKRYKEIQAENEEEKNIKYGKHVNEISDHKTVINSLSLILEICKQNPSQISRAITPFRELLEKYYIILSY